MIERVFDEWLKDELGHERIERIGANFAGHGKAVAKAHAHDLDVLVHQCELVAQRYLVLPAMLHREPQQVAESRQHFIRGIDVAVHQCRDAVEGIEQEVGLNLGTKRLELRLGQTRTQVGCCNFALPVPAVEFEGMYDPNHGPESH